MQELTLEAVLCWSVGLTLVLSLATLGYLHKPLRQILDKVCGTAEGAAFWAAFSHVVFVLLPLVCILTGFSIDRSTDPPVFQIAVQLQFALVGLVLAVFCVAIAVLFVTGSSRYSISVSAEQVEDLHNLLLKMEEYRAREILKRPNAG